MLGTAVSNPMWGSLGVENGVEANSPVLCIKAYHI
jgi:hypothetical protein